MSTSDRVTRFGLRNFKAFHYLDDIDLRPLTVLVGANSSGKSSIFQSLLLLKQSSLASSSSGLLKFDGDFAKLGSFATVISDFDTSRKLEYRFGVEFDIPSLSSYFPHVEVADSLQDRPLRAFSEIVLAFGWSSAARQVLPVGQSIRALLPDSMRDEEAAMLTVRNGAVVSCQHLPITTIAPPTLESMGFQRFWPESVLGKDVRGLRQVELLPPALSDPIAVLRSELEQTLAYLGPLRADPRPFYPVEEEPDIGPRGEGTIPYLLRHQHDEIEYVPSPTEDVRFAPLLGALNDWLQRMKVTSRLTIDPLESVAHTAAIRSTSATSKSVNLSQVGFGISQLLPVLVMSLKDPQDGWLLFEQPEIHLHPRLQGDLADVLLCAAKAGKTVMVETHSDHLVNRLRRRIAEDKTGTLANLVQILFVHAGTPDNPSSYVEPLTVDDTGTIVNCPADFFSETPDEAFAILHARQQKARRAGS